MTQEEIDKFNYVNQGNNEPNGFLDKELTPGKAKRLYTLKKLRDLNILKENWFDINLKIIEDVNYIKFTSYPDLKEKLISTGDHILIEGNYWGNNFWGMIKNKDGVWQGRNELGKILMKIREKLSI